MKISGITLLIFSLLIGFSLGIDLLMGFELKTSIHHTLSPFIVMETVELFVFSTLIFIAIGKGLFIELMKKKRT